MVVDLLPHAEHLALPHQRGTIEHIIVIEGTLEILVGNIWQKLEKGDGIKFNADQNHGYRNLTSHKARFHNIIHYT
jgi:quercetin dioxygenase-like cupin family protein